jgi:hypothetical protein
LHSAFRLSQPAIWLPVLLWLLTGALAVAVLRANTRRAGLAALVLLVGADLWVFAQAQGWRQQSPLVSAVPVMPQGHRAGSRTLSISADGYPYRDFSRVQALHAPGYNGLLKEPATNGYDAFVKTRYAALLGGMTHGGVVPRSELWEPTHHAIDILSTRYLRLDAGLLREPAWRQRLAGDRWTWGPETDGVVVIENKRALPRAWRPTSVLTLSPERVDALVTASAGFDPTRTALVESPMENGDFSPGVAQVRVVSSNRLQVTTDGRGPGLVAISESYDAGWQAWLGARRLRVHRVDGLILGLEVPAGAHTVDLRYEPPRWKLGLGLAGASALLLLLWALWARRRQARPTASAPT